MDSLYIALGSQSGVVEVTLSRALTYIVMFGLLVFFSSKIMTISVNREAILKSCVASVVMGLIVYYLAWFTNYELIMLPFISGYGGYSLPVILILFKALTPADAQFFKKITPKVKRFSNG